MSDTLTQVEMQRLYERGLATTVVDAGYHWMKPVYVWNTTTSLTPTALMLGACHDLAVEMGYKLINYGWAWASYGGQPVYGETLLHALVALWHKLKDEQEKQKPSEPEKDLGNLTASDLYHKITQLQSELNTLKDQIGHPWVFTTLGSPTMEQFTALQSDVAKLAEQMRSRYAFPDPCFYDIITRNRKES